MQAQLRKGAAWIGGYLNRLRVIGHAPLLPAIGKARNRIASTTSLTMMRYAQGAQNAARMPSTRRTMNCGNFHATVLVVAEMDWWIPDPTAGYWACAVIACHWQAPESAFRENEQGSHKCPKCGSHDVFPTDDDGWEPRPKPELALLPDVDY